ncbi:lysine-sensitive aspartokinase 3 [bacterium]|nr:lysine-sensitive aspartokinase 3 [bacterium]
MIVMKFGGTSVQDAAAIRSVIHIVQNKLSKRPALVVSALAGATNHLLESARLAVAGQKHNAEAILKKLHERHSGLSAELIKPIAEREKVETFLKTTFDKLQSLVDGVSLLGELTDRSLDMFAAQGELLSSTIIASAFREAGVDALWLDIREVMITDDQFTAAAPDTNLLKNHSARLIKPALEKGKLIVTQGFIGNTKDGITTTLGRGGSDYTAALLGAALDANDIEIWTDVDGVLTSDPKMVHEAKRVKIMTFQEASELAYFGAKVLHPATITPAVERNIPVHVFNTKNPVSSGTLITAKHDRTLEGVNNCVIKSIAYKKNITILNIASTRMLLAHGFLYSIFEVFKRLKISVDVISTTEVSVSLTIDFSDKLDEAVHELKRFAQVTVEQERAIVCLVGEQMRYTPGIAARTFNAIRDVNINMISQGASEINLTFVIAQSDVDTVVKRLHDEFFSGPLPSAIFE